MSKYDTSREDAEFARDCQMDDDDRRVERAMRRQKAVEEAVRVADKIILDASDGSCEMTNYLTAMLADRLSLEASRPHREAFHRSRSEWFTIPLPKYPGIIETAAQAALSAIAAGSDGSIVERNWLKAQVAQEVIHRAHQPFMSALLKKDIGL
jgi:hypothetical protein